MWRHVHAMHMTLSIRLMLSVSVQSSSQRAPYSSTPCSAFPLESFNEMVLASWLAASAAALLLLLYTLQATEKVPL